MRQKSELKFVDMSKTYAKLSFNPIGSAIGAHLFQEDRRIGLLVEIGDQVVELDDAVDAQTMAFLHIMDRRKRALTPFLPIEGDDNTAEKK